MEVFTGVVLLDRKKRIFLIREEDKHRIGQGRWNLPGGSIDKGEGIIEAVKREVTEETGYRAEVRSVLAFYEGIKGKKRWFFVVFKALAGAKKGETIDPNVKEGRWFEGWEFLRMKQADLVHPDLKLVYRAALDDQGLPLKVHRF
jgi:ADP-ribose pyrophosphatase YjhB (NUDIX family)